jgi:hypothetical protein
MIEIVSPNICGEFQWSHTSSSASHTINNVSTFQETQRKVLSAAMHLPICHNRKRSVIRITSGKQNSSVFPGLAIRKFQSIAIQVTGVAWYRAQFMFASRFPACSMTLDRQQIPWCPQNLQDQRPNQYKTALNDQQQQQQHFERTASSIT